jgi:3',5'-cyclic-AMP phosphodiesterase
MRTKKTSKQFSRRNMMKISAGCAAGAALGPWAAIADEAPGREKAKPVQRKKVLRLAHLTDIHVQPERGAEKWLVQCLHHVQQQAEPPELILNGGDTIMDSLGADKTRTAIQWNIWKKVVEKECSIPIENCIGNHDVWGWADNSGVSPDEPLYGKKSAMEAFGLEERYRSFEKAGWRFIVLDSTHTHPESSYTARLDEEQFEWLQDELEKVPEGKPILILSHIPILSACAYFDGENEKSGNWVVPHRWMHIDARRIKNLFAGHPNVRLCLSGHIHLLDHVQYNGVDYLCNGAVCGSWWRGTYRDCPPGYAMVNLYSDGSFEREYVTYGWREG